MATPKLNLDSFRRPDGSVDWATIPDYMDVDRLRAEEGALKRDPRPTKSHRSSPPKVERFAIQPGAKIAPTVRDLGGDEMQPVSEDAAAAALEEMSGKVRPRLLGPDPGKMVSAADLESLRGRMRGFGSRGPPLSGREAPAPPQSTIKFSDLMKPEQGTPEGDFGSPFPDRQNQPPTDAPASYAGPVGKVAVNRWMPSNTREVAPGVRQGSLSRDRDLEDTAPPEGAPESKPGLFSRLFADSGPAPTQADPVDDLAKLRAEAGGAVGAMKADTKEHELDRDFGRVEKRVADMSKPTAALQKFQASREPLPGPGDSGADRPQFDKPFTEQLAERERGPASPRQPLQAAQQMGMGAAPDTSKDEAELDAAAKARDQELLLAQIATNFGHYSDVLGGTQGPDRGKGIRENAQRALDDLKAKRGLRADAAARQGEMADKQYERAGIDQDRAGKTAKFQREGDFNDATSAKSKQARQIATSLYPKLVARIPPAEFQKMSGADIASFLAEAQPEKVGGAGKGGGLSGAQLNSVRNKIPANLKDTSDALDRANEAIEAIGGWDKMQVGLLRGATPTMVLDPDQADVRLILAGVAQAFLSSGAGKSITKQEREILLGMSGADSEKFMTSPAVFKRGMAIIEHRMQNAARQALAGVDEADQDKLLNDENGMGVKKDWIRGKADKVNPKGQSGGETRPGPDGKPRKKGADGRWHLVTP